MLSLQVLDIDGDMAELKFMKAAPCGTLYTWPERDDLSWQPTEDIVCTMEPPQLINQRSQFQFTQSDLNNIKTMFKKVYFK